MCEICTTKTEEHPRSHQPVCIPQRHQFARPLILEVTYRPKKAAMSSLKVSSATAPSAPLAWAMVEENNLSPHPQPSTISTRCFKQHTSRWALLKILSFLPYLPPCLISPAPAGPSAPLLPQALAVANFKLGILSQGEASITISSSLSLFSSLKLDAPRLESSNN